MNNFKGGKMYFDSRFQRFQSMYCWFLYQSVLTKETDLARYKNIQEFTRLTYSAHPQSQVWKSAKGLPVHCGSEGSSQKPVSPYGAGEKSLSNPMTFSSSVRFHLLIVAPPINKVTAQ